MATRELVTISDDLTGEELLPEDCVVVQFSIDGIDYEIDLSIQNAEELRTEFARYIESARLVPALPQRHAYKPRRRGK